MDWVLFALAFQQKRNAMPQPALTFITGATGFVGAAVARCLLEKGHRLRALTRAGNDRRNIAGLDIEIVEGDLGRARKLSRGAKGCRGAVSCRGRLPDLGARSRRHASYQCRRHACADDRRAGCRGKAHRLHELGRDARHSADRHAGRTKIRRSASAIWSALTSDRNSSPSRKCSA